MCRPCANEYQREYNATRDSMTYSRGFMTGFSEGVNAQRQACIQHFEQMPALAEVTCSEVAWSLAAIPKPVYSGKATEVKG